jgi:hypothetical protein
MSQKKAKEERKQVEGATEQAMLKIAKDSAPAIAKLVSDTNTVIKEMKENWSMEERIGFCKWFLDVATVEQLAETMGMVPKAGTDPAQEEMDFTGEHEVGETGLALMEDADETESESDASETGAEG